MSLNRSTNKVSLATRGITTEISHLTNHFKNFNNRNTDVIVPETKQKLDELIYDVIRQVDNNKVFFLIMGITTEISHLTNLSKTFNNDIIMPEKKQKLEELTYDVTRQVQNTNI